MSKNRNPTELSNELVYGVDEQHRRIYFGVALDHETWEDESQGDFKQLSVSYAIRALQRMAMQHPKTPIEIHMNSYGGDPYAMLALYDIIQSCTCQIKFFGAGAIMSAATWIMAGCDERYLYPNTRVMIHDGWDGYFGKFQDFQIAAEEGKYLQNKLCEIYADNSRMGAAFWEEVGKNDLYLSAEETISLGLADRIIHPKKRGNLRKMRQFHLNREVSSRKMGKLVETLMNRVHRTHKKLVIEINKPKEELIDEKIIIEAKKEDHSESEQTNRETETKQEKPDR